MASQAQTEFLEINSGTATFSSKLLFTSFTKVIFEKLYLDGDLRISVVRDLADQHIITQINSVACLEDPNNLIRLLPSKTNPQLEKFLVILLGGRGDEGTKEERAGIRSEFAKTLLDIIERNNGTPKEDQRIRTIHDHHPEFSKTLVEILQKSEHKLPNHIDYSNLEATSKVGGVPPAPQMAPPQVTPTVKVAPMPRPEVHERIPPTARGSSSSDENGLYDLL